MGYIDAIEGSLIAFVIFALAAIFIPGAGPSAEVELVLTVSTFLFAILAGFYIARVNSRYDNIREAVALEDANWLVLYKLSEFYGKSFSKRIAEAIDKYYIVSYDFGIGYYYKHNARHFFSVIDELKKAVKQTKGSMSSVLDRMFDQIAAIEESRNKTSVLAEERIAKGQWSVLILLAVIVIFSVFFLKVPDAFSQVVTVLLSTAIILVLLIIRDLQNFKLGGKLLMDESGQEVFEFIGKPRYYSSICLKEGTTKIPPNVKTYRLGMHRPGEKFKIKTVRI